MNIDWEEINKGYAEELEKNSGVFDAHSSTPWNYMTSGGLGSPKSVDYFPNPFYIPGKIYDTASTAGGVTREMLGLATDSAKATGKVLGNVGTATSAIAGNTKKPPVDPKDTGMVADVKRLRGGVNDVWKVITDFSDKAKNKVVSTVDTLKDLGHSGIEGVRSVMGNMGQYGPLLPLGAGLLAGGLGYYLLNRGGRKSIAGGQPTNININLGRGGMPGHLNYDPTQVSTFDSPMKYGEEKRAFLVSEIARAAGRRMADNAISKSLTDQKEEPKKEDKTVEITSKYPEINKILKKKKNKEYLERLMNS